MISSSLRAQAVTGLRGLGMVGSLPNSLWQENSCQYWVLSDDVVLGDDYLVDEARRDGRWVLPSGSGREPIG
jgi:hypothetical protein